MRQLLMQPVDTFFFRDQKDFTPGDNSRAAAVFPPRVGTVYGALRSAYIHQNYGFECFAAGRDQHLLEWMGTPDKAGRFSLQGVFIHADSEPVLPLPLDYQVVKDNGRDGSDGEYACPLLLEKGEAGIVSNGREYRLMGPHNQKSASASGAYLGLAAWKQEVLEPKGTNIYRASNWLTTEEKVGIARDWRSRASVEGMLYQIPMTRFRDSMNPSTSPGFVAVCRETPDFSSIDYLRLGGKNRPWRLKQLDADFELFSAVEEEKIIDGIRQTGMARLILLTPAIWSEDSAFYLEHGKKIRIQPGLELAILAVASGRPLLVGGWDIAINAPKKRFQAMPAGSVFHLKVEPEQATDLVAALKKVSVSDVLAYEGYGWAVCGAGYHQ